jgi:hypothetical protein
MIRGMLAKRTPAVSLVENQFARPGEAEPIKLAAVENLDLVTAPQQ